MAEGKTRGKLARPMNKKAQTPGDVILVLIVLFALAIGALTITYAYNQFYDLAANITAFNESQDVMDAFAGGKTVNALWDYIILFSFIGLAIGLFIIGYFLDVHSVFFPFYVIGLIIAVILSAIISYVWSYITDYALFTTIATTDLAITNHLLVNLPIYITVIGAISMIATYAKTRREGE